MICRLRNKKTAALLLMLGTCLVPACALGAQGAEAPIAILLSDTEEAYTRPVDTFVDAIKRPVQVFNLNGDIDNAPSRMEKILSIRPALIFALGAKAAYTAKVWTKDHPQTPVIFAMVINWRKYGLLEGSDNISGIASEVSPGTQLLSMTIASPEVKRIGLIYSDAHSYEIVQQAKADAEKLGLEIVSVPISRPKEFHRAYKQMDDRIDGFWMLKDPVVYTLENVSWLNERCAKDRIVCIGQSQNITKLGVLLAVNPDIPNIGLQAASMAKSILLRHQHPKQIGVMPPLGTNLLVNAKTAERIGLELNSTVKNLASEIIDE